MADDNQHSWRRRHSSAAAASAQLAALAEMVAHRWQLEADARHALVSVNDALGACRSKVASCISEYDAELLDLHAKIDKLQVEYLEYRRWST